MTTEPDWWPSEQARLTQRCSQCGRPFVEEACGPTHAAVAARMTQEALAQPLLSSDPEEDQRLQIETLLAAEELATGGKVGHHTLTVVGNLLGMFSRLRAENERLWANCQQYRKELVDIHVEHYSRTDESLKARLLTLRNEIVVSTTLSYDEIEALKLAVLTLILHLNHRIADRVTAEVASGIRCSVCKMTIQPNESSAPLGDQGEMVHDLCVQRD